MSEAMGGLTDSYSTARMAFNYRYYSLFSLKQMLIGVIAGTGCVLSASSWPIA